MATAATVIGNGCVAGRRWIGPRAGLLLILALLVVLPGCGGCRRDAAETAADAEKALAERNERLRRLEEERKKPDFEFGFRRRRADGDPGDERELTERQGPLLAAQPHDASPLRCYVKPGHWTMATMPAKANKYAVLGELETAVVDRSGNPLRLEGLPFTMTALRSAALQKGQPKRLEVAMYVPAVPQSGQPMLRCELSARRGGLGGYQQNDLLLPMPAYQYHFVVLAKSPELYGYVRDIDATKPPNDPDYDFSDSPRGYYRVCLLPPGRRVALPAHGLYWTSIAYMLWDDADPDRLTLDQQLAMLDWLHWGGQLIVSGPESLESLAGSFLAPYMPAGTPTTRELVAADLEELNRNWTVGKPAGLPLAPLRPWNAVSWQIHPSAREIPGTGGLLAERRVGRGRVVVSAFRLSQRELTTWESRHSFFNGCLLRRPPRIFAKRSEDLSPYVTWADRDLRLRQLDPLLTTNLRYFSRDFGRPTTTTSMQNDYELEVVQNPGPGVGGWNDAGKVSDAARNALTTAAKIEIPERSFVLWVVAAYLVVLVPLNWVVFRVLGRVEWAWVAAPAIALVCTGTVIHMARLDIGFARSLTEVDVVELQGDYPRAHVARYMAMYTSLATTYELTSEDPGAQILPLPKPPKSDGDDTLRFGVSNLSYRYGSEVALDDFRIRSNTADMAHTEQMLDLGGGLSLVRDDAGGVRVVNGTQYTIRGAGVVQRAADEGLRSAWLGDLPPGGSATVRFRPAVAPAGGGSLWQEERNRAAQTAASPVEGQLSLGPLCHLAEDTSTLADGDVRLVGWLDEALPGLEVHPGAPQARRAAVVVAHLNHGFGEAPRPDENTSANWKGL